MEAEGSLPYSQKPVTGPYPDLVEPSPRPLGIPSGLFFLQIYQIKFGMHFLYFPRVIYIPSITMLFCYLSRNEVY